MELLVNDLSIQEQFHDINAFRCALIKLISMRRESQRFGREIFCSRTLLNASPIPGVMMQQAIGKFESKNERRAILMWFTKGGPFWDDLRRHSQDDYFECRGEIVTDSAIGEAAYRKLNSVDCGLVSIEPSNWNFTPLEVTWRLTTNDKHTSIENYFEVDSLKAKLECIASPIHSWENLRQNSVVRFERLVFSESAFSPLNGFAFSKSAADRFLFLFDKLNQLAGEYDGDGRRSSEGHKIYQDYFTGKTGLFSDSSDSEKRKFKTDLTFQHSHDPDKLFCPWHGKVRHNPPLRVHFSWPIEFGQLVHVMYVGPKITRR